jgi:hypothetical protein
MEFVGGSYRVEKPALAASELPATTATALHFAGGNEGGSAVLDVAWNATLPLGAYTSSGQKMGEKPFQKRIVFFGEAFVSRDIGIDGTGGRIEG